MSIIWGHPRSGCQLGIEWGPTPAVDPNTTSIVMTADVLVSATQPITDSTNTLEWNWDWDDLQDGEQANPLVVSNWTGQQVIKHLSLTMNLPYGEVHTLELWAELRGLAGVSGGRVEVESTIPVPRRPFQAPRPPQNVTHVRNSDTQQTVSWTTDYTPASGGYPWSTVQVERRSNVEGWERVAELRWSATKFTDTSTRTDRFYQYRVRSVNVDGVSPWVQTTTFVYTTPADHTSLAWARPVSDVVLTWTKASTLPLAVTEIQRSVNGAAWATVATVTGSGTTWTDPAPDGTKTYQYRVRPTVAGLAGNWRTSTMVPALAAPLAPSGMYPSGITVDPDPGGTVTATWAHQPVDGTAQVAYEFTMKLAGGSYTSSGVVTSGASSRVLAGLERGNTYVYQVRTKGQHATWSPWSAEQSFSTGASPATTLTYPAAGTYATSLLPLAWVYNDLEGSTQQGYQVEVSSPDGVVYTTSRNGNELTWTPPIRLDNLTAYTIRVRTQDGSGLWSPWASVDITTDFVLPPAPVVHATFDPDTGAAVLDFETPEPAPDQLDGELAEVYRAASPEGPWVRIADGLPPSTTIVDPIPALGVNYYRVVTWTLTPTSAETMATVECRSPWVFLNGGPGFTTLARVKGGVSVGASHSRAKVLHQFVGRNHPTEFAGASTTDTYTVSGAVDGYGAESDQWGSWQAWQAIADLPAPLCLRDPMGRRVFVSITDVQVTHEVTTKKAKVSAKLTVVDHDE